MISNKRQIQHHEMELARDTLAFVEGMDLTSPDHIISAVDRCRNLACIILECGPEPHHRKTDIIRIKEVMRIQAQERLTAARKLRPPVVDTSKADDPMVMQRPPPLPPTTIDLDTNDLLGDAFSDLDDEGE